MHTAPAVDYPVGNSRFAAWVLAAVWACVAAVHLAWLLSAPPAAWQPWLGMAISLAAALPAWRAWRRTAVGRLAWDGQSWWWESANRRTVGAVAPHLDLQSVMLLGFDDEQGRRHWLWVHAAVEPSRWRLLRCAVHARRVAGTPDGLHGADVAVGRHGTGAA